MSVLLWAGVAILGGFGAVVRFVVDGAISKRWGNSLPWGTFVVNLSGAMVLGFLTGLALHRDVALLAGTAVIGSYTTFSTWMFETQRLSEERQFRFGALNIIASIVLGIAAAALGQWLGRQL